MAGVDAARGAWVVVLRQLRPDAPRDPLSAVACPRFEDVLEVTRDALAVAVDMPIGLPDVPAPGGREADRAARRVLGRRAVSVFSPPARVVLDATRWEDVRGRGMTLQGFHLLPRIREVDALMTAEAQRRIVEAHPELAFARLSGAPMRGNKKRPEGRAERLDALARDPRLPPLDEAALRGLRRPLRGAGVAMDDLVDAVALTVTAAHIARGQGRRLPADPPRDARGLSMEVWT